MPNNNQGFQAGKDKGVNFWPDDGSGYTSIRILSHSWSEQVDKLDVTHTGTGGQQALIPGILRGDGNVKGDWTNVSSGAGWAGVISTNPPNIRAGTIGLLQFLLSTSQGFTVPCLVTKVAYQSAVEGKVSYDFDVSLNYFASKDSSGSNSNYAYPIG